MRRMTISATCFSSTARHVGLVMLFVWALFPRHARAQNEDADPSKKPAIATRVVSAYRQEPIQTEAQTRPQQEVQSVWLDDTLVVQIKNLDDLVQAAQAAEPSKRIVLFLNGRPLKDITPYPPSAPDSSTLYFPIRRTEASREVWTYLLGKPTSFARSVTVSIGLEDGYAMPSAATVNFQVIPQEWFIRWCILFGVLLIVFIALVIKTNILRDVGPALQSGKKSFSLARVQAAWWLFLVVASYVFIGMITGDWRTTITGSVLVLMGISAGTVASAAVVDAGSPPKKGIAKPRIRFLMNILSETGSVSLHRFQMFTWTLVLGIVFCIEVYRGLAMPTFDGTLLALMGISSGTYVGIKSVANG